MRRILAVSLIGAAVVALAQRGAGLITQYVQALQEGQTLSATYTLQRVGGAARTFTIDFAKPNKLRIETPSELTIADGKQITTFDKANKTYLVQPQTTEQFAGLIGGDELRVWAPFFDGKAFTNAAASKDLGTKNRGGTTLKVAEATLDAQGRQVVTLYLGSDNIARQAELTTNNPDGKDVVILNTKSVALGGPAGDFTFTPPAGARQLTIEELNADRWYENLDEALVVAKNTKRLVLIDFYADW
jgi:outer membrane lipoprotein-sorting protein